MFEKYIQSTFKLFTYLCSRRYKEIHGLFHIVKKNVFMVVKSCIPEADFCLMLIKRVFCSPLRCSSARRVRSLVHPDNMCPEETYLISRCW